MSVPLLAGDSRLVPTWARGLCVCGSERALGSEPIKTGLAGARREISQIQGLGIYFDMFWY